MHPADCPLWEYSEHPRRAGVLRSEIPKVLAELRNGVLKSEDAAADSRALHGRIFSQLTPPGYQYYAGHFRGENQRCLKFCSVGILGDSSVGFPPQTVLTAMDAFIYRVGQGLAKLDGLNHDSLAQFTHAIRFACNLLKFFFEFIRM